MSKAVRRLRGRKLARANRKIIEKGSGLATSELCKTIKALIERGDRAIEKAEQFYIAAGKHLIELKARTPGVERWFALAKSECGIAKSRAYELVAIAAGRTTVAQVRAGTAARMQKSRASLPSRDGKSDLYRATTAAAVEPADAEPGVEDELDEDPENFRTAYLLRADQCNRSAIYTGPIITQDLVAVARRVAASWTQLANTLEAALPPRVPISNE